MGGLGGLGGLGVWGSFYVVRALCWALGRLDVGKV